LERKEEEKTEARKKWGNINIRSTEKIKKKRYHEDKMKERRKEFKILRESGKE
jgi:hypothetical protein